MRSHVSEYKNELDVFMSGGVVESPAPEVIAELDPEICSDLEEAKLSQGYGAHYLWAPSLDGGHEVRIGHELNFGPHEIATSFFCDTVRARREKITERFGRFSKLGGAYATTSVMPHLDTENGAQTFTTLMVVGRTGGAWRGLVKRDLGDTMITTKAVLLEGCEVELKSGVVYGLSPLTVHWGPKAPWLGSTPRYAWRGHHDNWVVCRV